MRERPCFKCSKVGHVARNYPNDAAAATVAEVEKFQGAAYSVSVGDEEGYERVRPRLPTTTTIAIGGPIAKGANDVASELLSNMMARMLTMAS